MSLEGAAGKNINLVYRHTEIAKSVQTNGHELESPRDFFNIYQVHWYTVEENNTVRKW